MIKKKKKFIAKKSAKAKHKKPKKSKPTNSKSSIQFIDRPALSDIVEPSGFRAVSISQAINEYAKPIIDYFERGIVKDINNAFQLSVLLWNYAISLEHDNQDKMKADIIKKIGKTLKMNSQESAEFFENMIKRKDYLLPAEIQPEYPMTMFIRKEEHHIIPEFNYDTLNVMEKSVPSDDEDKKLVQLINQMDKYIAEETDYDKWEDHYFSMEEKCEERFKKWLIDKGIGIKEYCEDFPYYAETYLNFIYRYIHEDTINLKTVLPIYIEEFFVDHVLRKVIAEPHEYIQWPPALKLFYNFLYEKGYIVDSEKIIKLLDEIEPLFIEIIRNRYS